MDEFATLLTRFAGAADFSVRTLQIAGLPCTLCREFDSYKQVQRLQSLVQPNFFVKFENNACSMG